MATLAELLAKRKQALNAGNKGKTVKPPEGRSKWRILPSWRPAGHAEPAIDHPFAQHFIKDGANALKAVYVCTDKTFGRPCAVCDAVQAGIKAHEHDPDMKKVLESARSTARILLNALHLDGPNPTTPVILEISPRLYDSFLNLTMEWGEEVLSLDAGSDVVIERTGKGLDTKYSITPLPASKSTKVDPSIMTKLNNLDDYVKQESEEQEKRALANVSAVSGLGMTARPSLSAPSRPALGSVAPDEGPDPTNDIPDAFAAAPAAAASAPSAAPTPAPAAQSVNDAELEALLNGLPG
ncbi:hypothetical protein [Achromobacter sp. AGC39]